MTINYIVLSRDVQTTEIPAGATRVLPAGTRVRIMQTLGGSYTVADDFGAMYRVDGKDADVLGITETPQPSSAPAGEFSEKLVWEQLKTVYDPEIPVNIVDLGLIYGCEISDVEGGHRVDIKMTMTAPGCGMADVLRADVERKLKALASVQDVKVEVVFDPPWHPGRMSEAAKLQLGLDLGPSDSSFPVYNQY
jgi:probable FeS assembly SUF system protein SufT